MGEKDKKLIKVALEKMIRDVHARGTQVLLLGAARLGGAEDAALYKKVAAEAEAQGVSIAYLGEFITKLLLDETLRADPVHANAEGNFLIAEKTAEFLWENGALDAKPDTALLKRAFYLSQLVEILNRNLFLLQGDYSQPGWNNEFYHEREKLGFKGNNYEDPDFSAIMKMTGEELDRTIAMLATSIVDRIQMGKLADMRKNHVPDERAMRRLMQILGMKTSDLTQTENDLRPDSAGRVRPRFLAQKSILGIDRK